MSQAPPLPRVLARALMFFGEYPRLVLHKRRATYGGDWLMGGVKLRRKKNHTHQDYPPIVSQFEVKSSDQRYPSRVHTREPPYVYSYPNITQVAE